MGRAGRLVISSTSYRYHAVRADGSHENGTLEVQSHEAAIALLTQRNLFPIDVREITRSGRGRRRLSHADLALATRMLATLLESGLPVSRALDAFSEIAPDSWTGDLPAVREAVQQGRSLASALEEASLAIPALIIDLVRAGEAGSGLAPAMRRAAEVAETSAAARSGIVNALAYPLVLGVAGLLSIGLLVGIVLPRFETILADLGQSLPDSTRFVLGAAAFTRAALLPSVIAVAALVAVFRGSRPDGTFRIRLAEMMLAFPLVGPIRSSLSTARACSALSALLANGVRVAPSMLHCARTAGNPVITARILAARDSVIAGHSMASALEAARAFTTSAVRLVRAGEETARVPEMLEHAARLEAERAAGLTRAATRLIEPVLIIVIAGIVTVVAAAMLQAVYSVRPTP